MHQEGVDGLFACLFTCVPSHLLACLLAWRGGGWAGEGIIMSEWAGRAGSGPAGWARFGGSGAGLGAEGETFAVQCS